MQWIMTCVSTVRYSVRFTGVPSHSFSPSRGLRQGDPLSPYLFLLVADGLSTLLKHNERLGNIDGVKVCRRALSVSHLLFVDDSLLFFRANVHQALVIKDVLSTFERCSGQLLSPNKCSLLINENCDQQIADQVRLTLGVERLDFKAKYLGLPTPHGRVRRGLFQPLEGRFHKRMVAWNEIFLSAVGKEVLIKSVAQALPVYVMSVFKLPLTLCDDLMKQIRAF